MRQDYPRIRRAGAELVVISPDSLAQHQSYGMDRFGEELPYLFVSDPTWDIARRYAALRSDEHPHGGFWNRSLWVVDGQGIITHKLRPWAVSTQDGQISQRQIDEYRRLFAFIGAESGDFIALCDVSDRQTR